MGWGGGGVGGGWGRSGTEMMVGSEKVVVVVAGRSCVWDEGQEEKEREDHLGIRYHEEDDLFNRAGGLGRGLSNF